MCTMKFGFLCHAESRLHWSMVENETKNEAPKPKKSFVRSQKLGRIFQRRFFLMHDIEHGLTALVLWRRMLGRWRDFAQSACAEPVLPGAPAERADGICKPVSILLHDWEPDLMIELRTATSSPP